MIAVVISDKVKLFKSIDDAILFLQKKDKEKIILELQELKKSTAMNKRVKAIKITEENEVIEYDSLEDLKNNIS